MRPELPWSSWLFGLAILFTLPWRRAKPLSMVALAFVATFVATAVDHVAGGEEPEFYTLMFMLVLPYSVVRWGSGREALIGALLMLGVATANVMFEQVGTEDLIGAYAILTVAMTIGTTVRFRERDRARQIDQVKLREREQLARDLHDTVAHHVSAIAIRAQAGLATASTNPEAAADALRVISSEASRTLAEMRAMVGALRRDEPAELLPNPTFADLERLATGDPAGPGVTVETSGELEAVPSSVVGAVVRVAQESITNARRHARSATRIRVAVSAGAGVVRLEVRDDGETVPRASSAVGYGIVGMRERTELLGGTLEAGPEAGGGWTVTAVLPTTGSEP